MVRPDGKIDANGRTHRKMNEKLLSVAVNAHVNTTFKIPVTNAFWMKTAVNEVGESEVAGTKANTQILEYFKALTWSN
jgi:hypothetical protein